MIGTSCLQVLRRTGSTAKDLCDELSAVCEQSGRLPESGTWSLWSLMLEDARRCYDHRTLGLDLVHPRHRWNISAFRNIQSLLMQRPLLRRLSVIVAWLEEINPVDFDDDLSIKGSADLPNSQEIVLRTVLRHLRSGNIGKAHQTAQFGKDGVTACVIAGVSTSSNSDDQVGDTVPLFAEYCQQHKSFENDDESRMSLLAALYDGAVRSMSSPELLTQLDGCLCGVLCGHIDSARRAFDHSSVASWHDELWAVARCLLVHAFTVATIQGGTVVDPPSTAFRDACYATCGLGETPAEWQLRAEERIMKDVAHVLDRASISPHLGYQDLAQLESLRYFLSAPTPAATDIMRARPEDTNDAEPLRFHAHLLLVQDVAFRESVLRANPQSLPTFSKLIPRFAESHVNSVPHHQLEAAAGDATDILMRIADRPAKASAVANLVFALRRRCAAVGADTSVIRRVDAAVLSRVRGESTGLVDDVLANLNKNAAKLGDDAALLTSHQEAEGITWIAMSSTAERRDATLDKAIAAVSRLWGERNFQAMAEVVDAVRIHLDVAGPGAIAKRSQTILFWDDVSTVHLDSIRHEHLLVDLHEAQRQSSGSRSEQHTQLLRERDHLCEAMFGRTDTIIKAATSQGMGPTCALACLACVANAVLVSDQASRYRLGIRVFDLLHQLDVRGALDSLAVPNDHLDALMLSLRALRSRMVGQ